MFGQLGPLSRAARSSLFEVELAQLEGGEERQQARWLDRQERLLTARIHARRHQLDPVCLFATDARVMKPQFCYLYFCLHVSYRYTLSMLQERGFRQGARNWPMLPMFQSHPWYRASG